MKISVPAVLLLLLLAPSVTSGAQDDKLIVPGQRIGKWTLEMTVALLEKMNGPAAQVKHSAGNPGESPYPHTLFLWKRFGLQASSFDGKSLTQLAVSDIPYHTRQGVGIGSPLAKVLAAYGRPTAQTLIGDDFAGLIAVIYDNVGLALSANAVTETVIRISVFRSGAARSIWQF
jgi:hypothetical protein